MAHYSALAPGRMFCEKYKCNMAEAACILRQERNQAPDRPGWQTGNFVMDPGCWGCAQGRELMRRVKGERAMDKQAAPKWMDAKELMGTVDLAVAAAHLGGRPASAERLKCVRQARGLSRNRLAKYAGVACSTITNLEVAGAVPYHQTREKLARACKVPIGWLFGDAGGRGRDRYGRTAGVIWDHENGLWVDAPEAVAEEAQEPAAPVAVEDQPEEAQVGITITIDPRSEPKIYKALLQAANDERRSTRDQAMHWMDLMARSFKNSYVRMEP
jgi:transcriptional regulator with XRE-family HTH domain